MIKIELNDEECPQAIRDFVRNNCYYCQTNDALKYTTHKMMLKKDK